MKKRVLYGLMASVSMFSIAAYADPAPVADASNSALTTKGYVDTGLKYVYDSIQGDVNNVQGDITNLQNALSDGNGGLIDVGDLQDAIGTAGSGNTPGTGLTGAVEELQDTIGTAGVGNTPGTGLTGDVEALQDTVGDNTAGLVKRVNDLENSSIVYTAGDGIAVTAGANQGDPATISLDLGTTSASTTYVYKTDANGAGTWQAMEVEDSWNPGFLTNP